VDVLRRVSGPVLTVVASASTAEEARRREEALEDAIETTAIAAMDGQLLPGAGAPAAAVASAIRESATEVTGREQLAQSRRSPTRSTVFPRHWPVTPATTR